MTENIQKNIPSFKREIDLINQLPYAITVHNNFDKIIYENSKATELFGLRIDDSCTSRWCHHSDYADNPCPMCPGKFTKFDKSEHKVFRKLIDSNLNIRYLEFETIPVQNSFQESDGYIEIVRDVTEGESTKVKNLQENVTSTEPRIYSLIKHGMTGSETCFTDKIYFTNNIQEFLLKLASFAFIGVLQNSYDREGLYGPLPVLDEKNYEMFTFAFSVVDHSIQDPRRQQHEFCLLLIIFQRNDRITSINRQLINDLLTSYVFQLQSIKDLNQNWFNLIKIELNKLIDSDN